MTIRPTLQAQTSTATGALTLNRCYELALAMSEADRILAGELQIAEARYRQSIGGLFPSFGLFLDKTYDDRRDENRVGQTNSGLIGNTDRSSLQNQENPLRTGVNVRWPIFTGFRTFREAEARRYDRRSGQLNRQRFRELLYQDVADVYFQILQYETSAKILHDENRALQARINELRSRVSIGRSRQGELLAARTDLAENLVESEENASLLRASQELLGFLTGLPPQSLALSGPGDLPSTGSLEAYLGGTGERADLLAQTQALRAERERLQGAEGGHLPSLSLEGNYYLQQQPDTGRDWNIMLRIELPLFEGGATRASVAESEARLRNSRLELQRLRRTADFETRLAYNDFVSAAARVVLLRESVALARSTYQVQLRDYRLGIVSNLEVLESLRRLHLIRLNLARTELTAHNNQVRLFVAAGRGAPDASDTDEAGATGDPNEAGAAGDPEGGL